MDTAAGEQPVEGEGTNEAAGTANPVARDAVDGERGGFRIVEIDGGAWVAKVENRPQRWVLLKNDVVLTQGDLTQGDPYTKTNPFLFSAGSGGPSAVTLDVLQGDEIGLLIHRVGPVPGTFVGIDMTLTLTIPEPGTLGLSCLAGCIVILKRRRRG